MMSSLVKYNENDEIVKTAADLLREFTVSPGRKGEAEKDGETDSSQAQNDGRIFHVDIGAE